MIERFIHGNRLKNEVRNSPNVSEEDYIVRKVQANPKPPGPKLAAGVRGEPGRSYIAETLRPVLRDYEFKARVAPMQHFIFKKDKQNRLDLSRNHANSDFSFRNTVILSKGSQFTIFGFDGKSDVWRKADTELNKQSLKATVKHGCDHLKVWACISAARIGRGYLLRE